MKPSKHDRNDSREIARRRDPPNSKAYYGLGLASSVFILQGRRSFPEAGFPCPDSKTRQGRLLCAF